MKFKHRQVPFKLKSIDDGKKGSIAGYGSVFNNADQYRDVVMPGAFQKSLAQYKADGDSPVMLWQHDSAQPIGVWTKLAEDGNGLVCEGELLIDDVPKAAEAHALLKAGAIKGLSIGYNVPADGMEYDGQTNVWKLTEVELWEISIVTFPANTEATVNAVKHAMEAGELPTIRQFEELLRDAGSFSRKQAEQIAKFGYANFLKQRDAGDGAEQGEDTLLAEIVASIKSFKAA